MCGPKSPSQHLGVKPLLQCAVQARTDTDPGYNSEDRTYVNCDDSTHESCYDLRRQGSDSTETTTAISQLTLFNHFDVLCDNVDSKLQK